MKGDVNHDDGAVEGYSFACEIWQDVKSNVEVRRDIIRHNFLRTKDLSNRTTPGLLLQYKYFLGRIARQRLKESKLQLVDYLILLLAGACLGSIIKSKEETFGASGYTYSIIAVCKSWAPPLKSSDTISTWSNRGATRKAKSGRHGSTSWIKATRLYSHLRLMALKDSVLEEVFHCQKDSSCCALILLLKSLLPYHPGYWQ